MSKNPALRFDSGLHVALRPGELAFDYGLDVIGPPAEMRRLNEIRPSLRDPNCSGPDPVYGIAMDVYQRADAADLRRRYLLFGVVACERVTRRRAGAQPGTHPRARAA